VTGLSNPRVFGSVLRWPSNTLGVFAVVEEALRTERDKIAKSLKDWGRCAHRVSHLLPRAKRSDGQGLRTAPPGYGPRNCC
jgi:hypothetical protein